MKNRQALADTVRAIASHLGWDWNFDEAWFADNSAARITGADGACVHLRPNTYEYEPANDTRLEISGSYPHHPRYGSFTPGRDHPHITVAASKAPHVIAKDIRKRFLPHYLPLYQKAIEARQCYEDGLERQRAAIQQLAEIMGSTAGRDCVRLPSHINGYGGIEVYEHGDAVKIEIISVPVSLAIEIATILADFERSNRETL